MEKVAEYPVRMIIVNNVLKTVQEEMSFIKMETIFKVVLESFHRHAFIVIRLQKTNAKQNKD